MKTKNLISALLLLVVCVVGAINAYNQSQTPQYSDLTLANIEAIGADGGGESHYSTGPGFEATCSFDYYGSGDHCTTSIFGCLGENNHQCAPLLCDMHGTLP